MSHRSMTDQLVPITLITLLMFTAIGSGDVIGRTQVILASRYDIVLIFQWWITQFDTVFWSIQQYSFDYIKKVMAENLK